MGDSMEQKCAVGTGWPQLGDTLCDLYIYVSLRACICTGGFLDFKARVGYMSRRLSLVKKGNS